MKGLESWHMILRILIGAAVLVGLAGWADRAPEWPHSGPMPDEPGHETSQRYKPIDEGTLSYRPVEPMPWGDVNSRVAPPGAVPAPPPSSSPAAVIAITGRAPPRLPVH